MSEGELEKKRNLDAAEAAVGRVFPVNECYCIASDLATLHDLLNALHSLKDRLEKAAGHHLHDIEEFIAVKVLRNFAHHQEEVRANARVVPSPAQSDLMMVCVIRQGQVEPAIKAVRNSRCVRVSLSLVWERH